MIDVVLDCHEYRNGDDAIAMTALATLRGHFFPTIR